MTDDKPRGSAHTVTEELTGVLTLIGVIWAVFIVSWFFPRLRDYGLDPRDLDGLVGIVTMPFLHKNLGHIIGNTVPLLVLLALLAGSRANSWSIVLGIALLGGALLWAFALQGNANHIGASGLVCGLTTFLILSGFLERRLVPLLVSVLVLFLYGTSLLMAMAPTTGISWDGHLYGALAGALVAFSLAPRREKLTAVK